MINKVRKISEYAIITMVFCVKVGAKEAEGHGIVLVAAPLRLYWLLRRQKRAEHVGLGTGRIVPESLDCGDRSCTDAG